MLSVVLRRLVRLGSFPACWRQANVTPIPNGPPSFLLPITDNTSVMSKVFERRLHRTILFFYQLSGTELGSQPPLTTRDRELVSVLEVRIEPGD